MAPRVPVRIKEVIYTLSPFEQTVLSGLWKDLPAKMRRKWNEHWTDAATLIVPTYAVMWYAADYKEKEKMHHRF